MRLLGIASIRYDRSEMSTPSTNETELLLRVNGVQPAFGMELGQAGPRADEGRADPYRQANVSYSLIQRRQGAIVRHTLVDCGMGVVPSLLELERTHGIHVVHEVLLTHPHLDHFAQLDWLSMCLRRSGRTEQPRLLPIYASSACWEEGPNRFHRYLAERTEFRSMQPGIAVAFGDISVIPFAVDHGPKAPGALGFVVQHGNRRCVITGDFLRVPEEDNPLLFDADVMFLDANTWHPAEYTCHQSVLGDLQLIDKWRPKRAYLLHYSGYEDRNHPNEPVSGPLPRSQLQQELRRLVGDRDVHFAEHGMVLGDSVAWLM